MVKIIQLIQIKYANKMQKIKRKKISISYPKREKYIKKLFSPISQQV